MQIDKNTLKPESDSSRLTPTLSEAELIRYFQNKFSTVKYPKGLTAEILKNLSCIGFARLILEEFGGQKFGRIITVEFPEDQYHSKEDTPIHAFVIPHESDGEDFPYNASHRDYQIKVKDLLAPILLKFGLYNIFVFISLIVFSLLTLVVMKV